MRSDLLGRYSITGIGETRIGHLPRETPLSLAVQAARMAIDDAGLEPPDIDGLLVEYPYCDPRFQFPMEVAEALGIRPRHVSSIDLGGASAVAAIGHGMAAIEAGLCRAVLFVNADCQLSQRRGKEFAGRLNWGYQDFEEPFGLVGAVGGYALAAQAHIHRYATPPEAFGEIAIAARRHAAANDNAQKRQPFSMTDYLESRWIVEPFRLLDCSLVSDYGGAFVLTRDSPAGSRPHALVTAFAEGHDHRYLTTASDLTTTIARRLADQIWEQSGLKPADIDLALLYDSFTYTVLVQLEDYGFCEKGKAYEYLRNAGIGPGGKLPVNPHGGLLSQGHSNGVFHLCEAVRQLRGEAKTRNLPEPRRALVTGAGGILLGTHAATILERAS